MKAATMQMMMMMGVMVVVLMMGGQVEGGQKRKWLRRRGCRRAAGEGVMEQGAGSHFLWTMTGLDEDDLRVTYQAGAFVPEGASVVFMYPRDHGQRALNLVPAKLVYDFTDPDNTVIAIRKARRGRGVCIVMGSDVASYSEMQTQLEQRNMTNREVDGEEGARRLEVGEPSDPSQFSEALRDICSQDLCGNPLDTVYYRTRVAEAPQDGEAADDQGAMMSLDRSYMLFNDRVVISGQLPRRRMWRQGRMMGRRWSRGQAGTGADGSPRAQRREERRQQRRQQRIARRQQRRQQAGHQV